MGRTAQFTLICFLALGVGSVSLAETRRYRTNVTPRPGETLVGPGVYHVTLPQTGHAVRGVFVIFDRGQQVRKLYSDPAVLHFAERQQLGVLLPLHCPAKGSNDIDVVPENGIGRALATALDYRGTESKHPELSRAALIYFGLSGAGSLAARMVNFAPERTIAAIEYARDQDDPIGIDTVTIGGKALAVPQFIIANGADRVVGTARPYAYFEEYRKRGAPLTFLIQNRTPHCCVANIKPIMLEWLADVMRLRAPSTDGRRLRHIDVAQGWLGTLQVAQSGVKEEKPPVKVWNAVHAEISLPAKGTFSLGDGLGIPRRPEDQQVPASATLFPAWLPSRNFAQAWLDFARMQKHPLSRQE
jgi:hypothetical protein